MPTRATTCGGGRVVAAFFVSAALTAAMAGTAAAQSHEAIIENCRETVGRPIVQACMSGSRDSGLREKCREQASPKVRACVMAAEQKIALAESQAVAEVRAAAADAAVAAAETVLFGQAKGELGDSLFEKGLSEVRAKLN